MPNGLLFSPFFGRILRAEIDAKSDYIQTGEQLFFVSKRLFSYTSVHNPFPQELARA